MFDFINSLFKRTVKMNELQAVPRIYQDNPYFFTVRVNEICDYWNNPDEILEILGEKKVPATVWWDDTNDEIVVELRINK